MTILSSMETPFGSEISLSGLLCIEETIRKRIESNGKTSCHDTIDTASCSEWTFSSLEAETMVPKSILRKSNSCENIESNENDRLKSCIEQPITSPTSSAISHSSRRRRRISSQPSPYKYECVKTRFPARNGGRRTQEPRVRGPRTEKTVEEQWVRTCRFLW